MSGREWEPKNDEQRQALAEVSAEVESSKAATARIWKAAAKAAELGVPKTHIAKATGISLATVNRHVGPTRNGSGTE